MDDDSTNKYIMSTILYGYSYYFNYDKCGSFTIHVGGGEGDHLHSLFRASLPAAAVCSSPLVHALGQYARVYGRAVSVAVYFYVSLCLDVL